MVSWRGGCLLQSLQGAEMSGVSGRRPTGPALQQLWVSRWFLRKTDLECQSLTFQSFGRPEFSSVL